MEKFIINVEGMMCEGCENRIQNTLKNIEGVESVIANHKDGTVTIIAENIDIEKIKEMIEDIGFVILEK